jgi:integrase
VRLTGVGSIGSANDRRGACVASARRPDRAKKGNRLTGISLHRVVRGVAEDAGVRARPHGVRHTALTEACKAAPRLMASGWGRC